MGSFSLLQGIFPTQGSNQGLPHCRWILYNLWFHLNKPSNLTILEANHVHSFTWGNPHLRKIPLVVDCHKRWHYHCIRLNHFLNRIQVLVYLFHNLMHYFYGLWKYVPLWRQIGQCWRLTKTNDWFWVVLDQCWEGWNHWRWRAIAPGICF